MKRIIFTLLCFKSILAFSQQTQTITAKIASGSDDVEVSTRLYAESSDLELGGFDSDNKGKQFTALRFTNIALPVNAIVTKAYIQFTTKSASNSTASLNIKCQVGNAPVFTTYANIIA